MARSAFVYQRGGAVEFDESKIVCSRPEWRDSIIDLLRRALELTPEKRARIRAILGVDKVDVRPGRRDTQLTGHGRRRGEGVANARPSLSQ